MRFLVDAQLPPALVRILRDAGHTCEHATDIGLREAEDAPIWGYQVAQVAAVITKDEDFANRKAARPGGPQIVWVRIGNCSNSALLTWFAALLPDVVQRLQDGEPLVELV
jgi:predicted nuclease of predicted toxin-antitoxin system